MLLLLLASWLSLCGGVMFPEDDTGSCLRGGGPVVPCVMSGAVSWLEDSRSRQLQVDEGVLLAPEPEEQDLQPLGGDPRETTTLLEALERAVSSRRLLWQLDWLFPGLTMVIGRGPQAKVFFTLDRRRSLPEQDMSTGRLMVKRTLVPMLLGVQLKAGALVPLLVAALLVLTKKAFLLSKLSLLLSGYGLLRRDPRPPAPDFGYQEHWLHADHFNASPLWA